ncbi:agmatine deiminase family protein [Amycolatopsis samaneae]|uniref:Agmatine/peptidylarginine deiminase n=1 Tax=Amycolatopsis samaneae TaxID=664691 RepID=A0ABW5GPV8_9PSEU
MTPVRVPADWAPHSACVLVWPWLSRVWGRHLAAAQREFVTAARTIARFEPVLVLAHPVAAPKAREWCGPQVKIAEVACDDLWARDTCPVFAIDERGALSGLDSGFDGWSGKALAWWRDAGLARELCALLGVPSRRAGAVLDAGAVLTDGEGTLILGEECLRARNPGLGKEELTRIAAGAYGAEVVIWLPFGLFGDETDGHVDGVAAFLGPGRVLAQSGKDCGGPDEERLARNLDVLRASTDARGRALEVVEIREYPEIFLGDEAIAVNYVNFYLPTGAVVVPMGGVPEDEAVLALLRAQFPDRSVVGVPARALAWGGGGIRCLTQPIPRLTPVPGRREPAQRREKSSS